MKERQYTTSWFNLYVPDHYIPHLLRFLSYSVTREARTSLLVAVKSIPKWCKAPKYYMQNCRFLMYCNQELVYFALLIKKTRNIQDLSIFSRIRYYSFRRDMCNSSLAFFHVTVCLWCTKNRILFIGFFSKWKREQFRKYLRIYSHLFKINYNVKYKKSRNMEMVNITECSGGPKSLESREIK